MKRIIYLLAFAALFAACSSDDDNTQKGIPFNETEKEIAANSPAFAIKLMRALDATLEDNNSYVVSPLGASMALSMAMNGAQGETYDQIAEALSFGDYSLDEINSYKALKEVVEDMQAHRQELGIEGVFASTSLKTGEDWRWHTHLLNVPLSLEFKDKNIDFSGDSYKAIDFKYADNFKITFFSSLICLCPLCSMFILAFISLLCIALHSEHCHFLTLRFFVSLF